MELGKRRVVGGQEDMIVDVAYEIAHGKEVRGAWTPSLRAIADEFYRHQTTAKELEKLTLRYEGLTVDDAYEIQRLAMQQYMREGDPLIGWKMGLTSKAKQQSVGVDEAIFGHLLSRWIGTPVSPCGD